MDTDGIFGLIRIPQFLEDKLGQKTRVAEYQRDFVSADFFDELRYGMLPAMARPRHAAFGEQDCEIRFSRSLALNQADLINVAIGREPCAIVVRVGDRCRQRDALKVGCEGLQARERQAEQIAALAVGKGMDLVNDNPLQRGEHMHAVFVAE